MVLRAAQSSLPDFCTTRGCTACQLTGLGVPSDRRTPGRRLACRLCAGWRQGLPRPLGVAALIADAEARAVVAQILNSSDEFHGCGLYSEAAQAARVTARLEAHLFLVEHALPDACGIRFARDFLSQRPQVRVVLISSQRHPFFVHCGAEVGIEAWLVQPLDRDQCLATLRFVAQRMRLSLEAEGRRVPVEERATRSLTDEHSSAALTLREKQVLGLRAAGLLYKEVADRLHVSPAVVRKNIHRAFHKLHAANRAEALATWDRAQTSGDTAATKPTQG